eukprot:COSAG02_NODE_685_length_18484_cov_49.605330_7_plen_196_part_00
MSVPCSSSLKCEVTAACWLIAPHFSVFSVTFRRSEAPYRLRARGLTHVLVPSIRYIRKYACMQAPPARGSGAGHCSWLQSHAAFCFRLAALAVRPGSTVGSTSMRSPWLVCCRAATVRVHLFVVGTLAAGGALAAPAPAPAALAAPSSATRPLILLQDPRARCMDGTQGGLYVLTQSILLLISSVSSHPSGTETQ